MQEWRQKLAVMQEWSTVERACMATFMPGLLYLQYVVWGLYALDHDPHHKLVDASFLLAQIPLAATVVGTSLLLTLFGLRLNRHYPEALWFQHLAANFFGLTLVWGGYLVGTLTLSTGLVLTGAPLVGFLLLERRVMMIAITVAFAGILGLNLSTAFDLLPYAPALLPPRDTESALLWTHSQLFFALPHLIANTALCAVLLSQWRRREAHILGLSLTDPLTGIHNRRSILDLLEKDVAHSRRHGPDLAVALLDLDHFKRINDTWGHPTGDRVLRAVAQALKAALRQTDAIGRFGGEEFLLLLPHTPPDAAALLLDRCRVQLSALDLRADNGARIPVTASFGLACPTNRPDLDAEALVQAADAALYEAKQAGRNRVKVATLPTARVVAASAPASPSPVRRHADAPRSAVDAFWWKSLRGWKRQIAGVVEWPPAARAALVMGFLLPMLWGVLLTLLAVMWLPQADRLIDTGFARTCAWILLAEISVATLVLAIALRLRQTAPETPWIQHLAAQLYALSMVSIGYALGIMYLPTGAVLTSSPMIGFILFAPAVILPAFVSSVLIVIGLAYASALGWLPYAPLVSVGDTAWQLHSPFWVFCNYLFYLPIFAVTLVLADQIFGHWRQREAHIHGLSLTDALTGVHNRRSILRLLDKEVARTFRHGPPLAVVILDLDHFKRINDAWGHPTGDRVLKEAARVLQDSIRQCDSLGRYGGEEFLLLLPDTTLEGAAILAERCRIRLAETVVTAGNGDSLTISGSFGLVSNEQNFGLDTEALIRAADEALYRAKEAGRNRVEAVALAS